MPHLDRLYLTQIHQTVEGDAYFPEFDLGEWVEISREDRVDPMPFSFIVLERRAPK
jgi:dihydrofolate reductase